MVTLKDVAKKAGVAVITVSRVVNQDKNVKPATRLKVQKVIDELGYQPNNAARMMRGARSNTIAFLTDEVLTTPYSVKLIAGAQTASHSLGKLLLVAGTQKNPIIEEKIVQEMLEHRVEGFIYATMYYQKVKLTPLLSKQPLILVNCYSEDPPLPSIVPNDYLLGVQAAEYCVQRGHTKIAVLGLYKEALAYKERLKGYMSVFKRYNIEIPNDWIRSAHQMENGTIHSTVEEELNYLLEKSPRPTALLCGNDDIATHAYLVLLKRQISIPDEISLVGVDNQEIIILRLLPGLTTFELPYYEMGFRATKYIVDQRFSLEQEKVSCPLIERNSVKTLIT